MNLNKLRLKWKIFAFLLGFCVLLLMILWLFQTVFLDGMYRFIRTRELSQAIKTVEREIDSPDLQSVLFRLQSERDILVMPTPDFVPPLRPQPEMWERRGNVSPMTITESKEFELRDGQTISLTFHAMITPVSATVSTLRMQIYLITGVMIILAVLLAIVIARRVSKPIEEINRSALTLAKGNYNGRFNGRGFAEIVELSETLNTTAVELGKVEKLRRELLANVSHDLRTPLALLYSYAEMMNDFPGEITSEQTKVIMDETQRLTTLVNDVLDISKLENDMEMLIRSRFNLTQNILETVERMGALLKSDGFILTFSYAGDIYVDADKQKIDRAFYNLLINAVNYSGENHNISVTQTVCDKRVRISITDYGDGIAEEDLPFIWDRYFKSGKKHKRAVIGTGLGLSIVKKIIELHGGSYRVISQIGKGSTFEFELDIDYSAFQQGLE
ncbi:MAG: HAMP domain-containing histidine kinase [Oscillospiraceae bacterium]|nr:HAMP domain-containing histidine kinase [Oscillospiraceae bacterium]